ncbi:MAG: bacillithiol biosynthesis deacetylase BshB1 [Gemmatimonadetes bacterium]|jgi:N-acetylglucosamine malate deacetylase 1|nr:bacillithiol biosynthesis deacetylase BshB1 [Gemmatimonadota bacterium]
MTEPLDLLAIMAHPDDAELLCGGALIKSAAAGRRVGVLDLTAGEMGSTGSPEVRALEAARAAEIMGLAERRCAHLPDSALENDNETRHVVAEHLRALRPRVVITHWKVGRHRDHRLTSEIVRDACFLSGLKKLDGPGEPFRPTKLVYATAFREDVSPDFVVDISPHIEARIQAIEAYQSQFDGAVQAGEVFPGGERPLADQIRAQLAHYGSLIRVAYGEPYCVDEVLEVGDLADLGVSSF